MKWPIYGWKFVILTILHFLGNFASGSVPYVKMGIDSDFPTTRILTALICAVPTFLINIFSFTNVILFLLTWIDNFGLFCLKYSNENLISHVEKCLKMFNTLQQGLGKIL